MRDAPFFRTNPAATGSPARPGPGAAAASQGPQVDLPERSRGVAAQIVDNIIRQRLRIGNPNDPVEVARGLRQLFPGEARELEAEAAGLPTPLEIAAAPNVRAVESMATSAEMAQAEQAVDRDLLALSTDHRLGDITQEISGWWNSIRGILAEGQSAAALALDPRARDRLLGARRQLGEYSRLARMIGALSPDSNSSYRRLGSDLDEAASLLLVLAGENLAGRSLGNLRVLPSIAASDLQARRDGVIAGLRAMLQNTEGTSSSDGFPWAMEGYRKFMQQIEASGHLDLRALLDEATLGRALDGLVEQAARNDAAGLRALGATAELSTQQLHWLLNLGGKVASAPGLAQFLKALQLFLDSFTTSAAGHRLFYITRPLIAQRARASMGQNSAVAQRMTRLASLRTQFAARADCFLGCNCDAEDVLLQIMVDKILHDLDRAMDLYISGHDIEGKGEPEWRAAAYGLLAYVLATALRGRTILKAGAIGVAPIRIIARMGRRRTGPTTGATSAALIRLLTKVGRLLGEGKIDKVTHRPLPGTPEPMLQAMEDELCLQSLAQQRLASVIATMSFGCVPQEHVSSALSEMIGDALELIRGRGAQTCSPPEIGLPDIPPLSAQRSARALELIRGEAFRAAGSLAGINTDTSAIAKAVDRVGAASVDAAQHVGPARKAIEKLADDFNRMQNNSTTIARLIEELRNCVCRIADSTDISTIARAADQVGTAGADVARHLGPARDAIEQLANDFSRMRSKNTTIAKLIEELRDGVHRIAENRDETNGQASSSTGTSPPTRSGGPPKKSS